MSEATADRFYAIQTSISKLWRASLAYRSCKMLQLVRLRQCSEYDPSDETSLCSLPNEIFQHILSFARVYEEEECINNFPYVQLCECVTPKAVWAKQITRDAFDAWILEQHQHVLHSTVASIKAAQYDVLWSRLLPAFEATKEWQDLLVVIQLEAFDACQTCPERWVDAWLDLSKRRCEYLDNEHPRETKKVVNDFLNDHCMETLAMRDEEDWQIDDGEDLSVVQEYTMTLVLKSHAREFFTKLEYDCLRAREISDRPEGRELRAFGRFAMQYGLVTSDFTWSTITDREDEASVNGDEDAQGQDSDSQASSEADSDSSGQSGGTEDDGSSENSGDGGTDDEGGQEQGESDEDALPPNAIAYPL